MSRPKVAPAIILKIGKFRIIRSDPYNLILQRLNIPDKNNPKTKPDAKPKWIGIGFYGKLEQAIIAMMRINISEKTNENLEELLNRINNARDEIIMAIHTKLNVADVNVKKPKN